MRMMPRSPSCSTWQEVHCVAFGVELRRLLRPEIRARMAGETGPGFDALPGVWQAVHWPAKDWWRSRAGRRYELRHQPASLGASDRHPDRDRGDHHQQGCDEDGIGKTLPAHSQRSP
ncbi:hypothetical protein [Novosphingobium sp. EMRT-2]|uniref:hypothetical protein n=1 Tax=Novosphingobium sp. EMRT-2 TaxID=2571749 RepID=UPI001AEF4369|nr:hypothetical protein [Novosphingobium sp. EMRT-2]